MNCRQWVVDAALMEPVPSRWRQLSVPSSQKKLPHWQLGTGYWILIL
jgi:hypothetical protein